MFVSLLQMPKASTTWLSVSMGATGLEDDESIASNAVGEICPPPSFMSTVTLTGTGA